MTEYTFDVHSSTFARLFDGTLTFHICVDSWSYAAGDTLCFRETHAKHGFTGRKLWKRITWVGKRDGLQKGYCCLALGDAPEEEV